MDRREFAFCGAVFATSGLAGCLNAPVQGDPGENESHDNPRGDRHPEGGDSGNRSGDDVPGCTDARDWTTETDPGDAPPDSIAGRRDCTAASRPEPTGDLCTTYVVEGADGSREFRSVGVEPYPDPPETDDEESLISFVHEYERAYSHNSAVSQYGKSVVSASVGVHEDETDVLDVYDEITVVRIEFGIGLRIEYRNSAGYYEDRFGEAAVYGVDGTGIVRAEADGDARNDDPADAPDPVEDGVLLECF